MNKVSGPEDSDDDLLGDIQGVDEVLAIILDQSGTEGLREFIAEAIDRGIVDRESLEQAAGKMADAGLTQASLVQEAAETLPPKSQSNPFPEGTADWRDWNRRELNDWTGFLYDDDERKAKGKAIWG
jgi:hypothetical protein